MFKMSSHDPFGYLKHKLWTNEGSGIKLPIWLLTTKSLESPQFTYIGIFLMKATTLLQTSSQSEVYTKSYELPKSWEFQFREFWMVMIMARGIFCDNLILKITNFWIYLSCSFQMITIVTHGLRLCVLFFESFGES
jgi:hypothetical protein